MQKDRIIDNNKDKLIGSVGLHQIDHFKRKAELGIFIGDKEYREKNCTNIKLRKIFELACEYDPEDIKDMWYTFDELGDDE